MTKKFLMACAALVAFAALALPAAASATIIEEEGVPLAVGTKITATQVGTSKMTSTDGTQTILECSTGSMTGELTKNKAGEPVEGKITSAIFGGTGPKVATEPHNECTGESAFGNTSITPVVSTLAPWCIRTINGTADEFTVSSGNCPGGGKIKFIMATTLVGNCEYEATEHLVGTYTTGGTSATATLSNTAHTNEAGKGTTNGFKRISGSIFCPSSSSLDMTFTFETHEATAKPLVFTDL